ncbi:MAG: hypothetical protein WCT18_01840 [Patescibacteria group bacterium]
MKIKEILKKILGIAETVNFAVIGVNGLDLAKFQNSLHYFFDEVFFHQEKYPEYDLPMVGVVVILANDGQMAKGDFSQTKITVSYDKKLTDENLIKEKLSRLGIKI